MKRALLIVAVALGVGMMGCATDVEDPIPPTPAPEPQRDPPKETLSGELRDPQAALISQIGVDRGFESVPAKQRPPLPQLRVPDEAR